MYSLLIPVYIYRLQCILVIDILSNNNIIIRTHYSINSYIQIKHAAQSLLAIYFEKQGMKGETISDECMENLAKGRLTVKIMHFFLNLYPLQVMLRKFIISDIAIVEISSRYEFIFSKLRITRAPAIKVTL